MVKTRFTRTSPCLGSPSPRDNGEVMPKCGFIDRFHRFEEVTHRLMSGEGDREKSGSF